jgi:hypothetical protein
LVDFWENSPPLMHCRVLCLNNIPFRKHQ